MKAPGSSTTRPRPTSAERRSGARKSWNRSRLPEGSTYARRMARDLQCGAKHVAYEIRMVARSVDLIDELFTQAGPSATAGTDDLDYLTSARVAANLALEGYLLHQRALLEFLGARERRHKGDITLGDFGLTSHATRQERDRIEQLDQRLAHLSWRRCENSGRSTGWTVRRLALDLLRALRTSLDQPDGKPEAGALVRMADLSLVELGERSAVPHSIASDPDVERIFRVWTQDDR